MRECTQLHLAIIAFEQKIHITIYSLLTTTTAYYRMEQGLKPRDQSINFKHLVWKQNTTHSYSSLYFVRKVLECALRMCTVLMYVVVVVVAVRSTAL